MPRASDGHRGLQRAWSGVALAAAALLLAAPSLAQPPTIGYYPDADPVAALEAAESEAAKSGKLVLVIAGGEWCIWCHYLNKFIHENADIEAALEDTFVIVKVYYEEEGDNEAFFATMPKAPGYPHFWIRNAGGELLASQGTLPFEDGDKSYDHDRFLAFIADWHAKR
jgi:Thioredoxin-like